MTRDYSLIPPSSSYNVTSIIVPISDTETAFYLIAWGGKTYPTTEQWRKFNHTVPGVDVDHRWVLRPTLENNFLQDLEMMKQGNFTGVLGPIKISSCGCRWG